jgi:hypothetical protein
VPRVVGTYLVSITLGTELPILGSPFTVEVLPGEISPAKSFTSIESAEIHTLISGITYLFDLSMKDIYDNSLVAGGDQTKISIVATHKDHDDWGSPIGI